VEWTRGHTATWSRKRPTRLLVASLPPAALIEDILRAAIDKVGTTNALATAAEDD